MVQMFFVTLHRLEGEISSRRCISLLFRTLPKRPEKPIWNKSDLKSKGNGQEMPFLFTDVAMHHVGVEAFLFVNKGSNFSGPPLGKVHKSGHAILCAFSSAFDIHGISNLERI